jgi:hypothetical protein
MSLQENVRKRKSKILIQNRQWQRSVMTDQFQPPGVVVAFMMAEMNGGNRNPGQGDDSARASAWRALGRNQQDHNQPDKTGQSLG